MTGVFGVTAGLLVAGNAIECGAGGTRREIRLLVGVDYTL